MSPAPFTRWLLKQAGRDDPIGDLAHDARHDPSWPQPGHPDACHDYLLRLGVSEAVLDALAKAREEFRC